MEYLAMIKLFGPWLIAGGVAYGGVRAGLNGQKKGLDKVTTKLDNHIDDYHEDSRTIVRSLSSLETKVDLLIDHKIKE
jgi:hypothetical protein